MACCKTWSGVWSLFGVEFGVSFGVEFGIIFGVKFEVIYIYITIQNRHKKIVGGRLFSVLT
jgi:hypothetical protein